MSSLSSWLSAAEVGDGPDYDLVHLTVLACGSREWTDAETIYATFGRIQADSITLIHGDARGADRLAAAEFARMFDGHDGYAVRAFPADWKTHGKRAGYLRNLAMLDEEPDLVLAFQVNGSRGTQHTINEARRRGIQTYVLAPESTGEPA